jgi:NADH dehydrogenase
MSASISRNRHRVVVVGGGFGGLHATKALAGAPVDITLVDRVNHHLFQPLLYQVASGILSEGLVAPALRGVLRRQANVRVVLAEVTGFDLEARLVVAQTPDEKLLTLPYDSLIVATGVESNYFGHDAWEQAAPGLKTLADARWLRTHILGAFELAEVAGDAAERQAWLTFVIVGAGPTGVELSGEIATLAHVILPRDFRHIATTDSRIILVDAGPSVLPAFPPRLRRRAAAALAGWGIEIRTDTIALGIDMSGIDVRRPDGLAERIPARTVVWAAGAKATASAASLAAAGAASSDRLGRIEVLSDLTLAGHPEVFAIGDMAHVGDLPGVAPVAMQEGRHAAHVIERRLAGEAAPPPFRYVDKGMMAQVGPRKAVVNAYGVQVSGFMGSLMWAFVHLLYLIGWGNRLVTLLRWLLQLTTRNRDERLVDVQHAQEWGRARSR